MILKLINDKYIDVDSYGCKTWGTLTQVSIEKNQNGEWCERHCICIDPMCDEWHDEWIRLNVEEELSELPEGFELYNKEDYETFMEIVSDWL